MAVEVYIDGACEPVNPGGTASWGVVVYMVEETLPSGLLLGVVRSVVEGTESPFKELWSSYGIVGSGPGMSNNVGEYAALVAFLEWYTTHYNWETYEDVVVKSDSNLLVQQMDGAFKVRKGLYVPYYRKVMDMFGKFTFLMVSLDFEWIPREQNLADALSVKALNEVGIYRRTK